MTAILATGYVLMVTITSHFAAHTERAGDSYQTYQQCAEDAVGRVESMRPLYPNATITWDCQRDDDDE